MKMRRALGAAAAGLFTVGVIAAASFPTGASSATATVPSDARVAGRSTVGSARVLLLSASGRLRVLVVYPGPKGWLSVRAPAPPASAAVAWMSTAGGHGVPALAAVYGRAPAGIAPSAVGYEVTWADGQQTQGSVAADGTFLTVRPGAVRSRSLVILGAGGARLLAVDGP